MPRTSQQLHPYREPVATRLAATVLLLRDAPGNAKGIEVLMTRRSDKASFAPGAYVFPGGGIDALDAQSHSAADRRPTQSDLHLTQAIAAIRESFEELGVLLARHAGGPRKGLMADAQDIAAIDRHQPFVAQCTARGLRLAADSVFMLAHWITDRDLPRRFDVPFLVARMPEGQEPVADEAEQFEPVWVRPADALARHEAGQFFMIFPTIRTLQRLATFATTQAVFDAVDAIKGGVVPREFIPAVEKGINEAVTQGVLAGYPVVDVKVTLHFGSYHDVDSNELAFKMAAIFGFKEGCRKAGPVILEPMMAVEVETPEDYAGTVMGDLSSRRGMVQGMDDIPGGGKAIRAEVPLSEMFGYSTSLRSATRAASSFAAWGPSVAASSA